MIGTLRDLTINRDRSQNITLTVQGDFRASFDSLSGKTLDIEIKVHRERRSLDANAYFHVLVNKIAAVLNESDEIIKRQLVLDYGAVDRCPDGGPLIAILPATANVDLYHKYTRFFSQQMVSGVMMNCYLVFKPTHRMDTAEMARLIDGTITEAKELGIETMTPAELARLKEAWGK